MLILPAQPTKTQLLDAVRQWVGLLAAGDLAGAQALLTQEGNQQDWPIDRVARRIAAYEPRAGAAADGRVRVTPLAEAKIYDPDPRKDLLPPIETVVRWIPNRDLACTHPGRVGEVLYDLPINGYFSNLTAVFWIRQVKGGWALELFDLTVFGEGADKG